MLCTGFPLKDGIRPHVIPIFVHRLTCLRRTRIRPTWSAQVATVAAWLQVKALWALVFPALANQVGTLAGRTLTGTLKHVLTLRRRLAQLSATRCDKSIATVGVGSGVRFAARLRRWFP